MKITLAVSFTKVQSQSVDVINSVQKTRNLSLKLLNTTSNQTAIKCISRHVSFYTLVRIIINPLRNVYNILATIVFLHFIEIVYCLSFSRVPNSHIYPIYNPAVCFFFCHITHIFA